MSGSNADNVSREGQTFGRFRVVRLLGAGGMGEVFLARDDLLGREVAIKTLCIPDFAASAGEAFRARFLNEARAIASLSHPNVVRVFDLGFQGETPYLVMEVVAGPSLRERLKSGRRLSHGEVRALGIQISGALQAAHACGILHRDVKAGNILEAKAGLWKLADFGVARVPDSSLTMAGQFLGSPAYAAPEALLYGKFSPASDVFSLGATLYEVLTGETPYGRAGDISLEAIVQAGEPPDLAARCPDIPPDLAQAIMRAIARDPMLRPDAALFVAVLAGGATLPEPSLCSSAPSDETVAATPRAAVAAAARRSSPQPASPASPLQPAPVSPGPGSVVTIAAPESGPARAASALSPPPRKSRTLWLAAFVLGALLLVGLGVGLGIVLSGQGRAPAAEGVAPVPGRAAPGRPAPRRADAQMPAMAAKAEPRALEVARSPDGALSPAERDRQHAEQWQRIRELLAQGELDEGIKELTELSKRYPEDEAAPELLQQVEQVRASAYGRGRGWYARPPDEEE